MKRVVYLLIVLLPLISSAQEGTPYIRHFDGINAFDNQNWSVCQDSDGIMFFANRHGILTFDGYSWNNYKLQVNPMVLEFDPFSRKIFVGGRRTYGYLDRDDKGSLNYHDLTPFTLDPGIISGIIFEQEEIYFYGENSVSVYSRADSNVIKRWQPDKEAAFTGVLRQGGTSFINIAGKGLHRIESDTLFPIVTGYLTKNTEILFQLPYQGNRILVGKSDNSLSLFDGLKYYDYNLSSKDYLKQNILNGGIELGEKYYAFSTLYGGVLICDKESGKIVYTVNYQTGLPDDEVYALGKDNNNGLWLTHSGGVSRIDTRLPLTGYSGFPGLEGIPVASARFNEMLYIATNKGLFVLDEVKNYREVEVYYQVMEEEKDEEENKNEALENQLTDLAEEAAVEVEKEEPRRNIFSRLFRKKESKEAAIPVEEEVKDEGAEAEKPKQEESTEKPGLKEPVYRKRTVSQLQSISWMYKRVEGIDTRCDALVQGNNRLFAISGTGLHLVDGKNSSQVYTDRKINTLLIYDKQLIIGSDEGLRVLRQEGRNYIYEPDKIKYNSPVYSLAVTDKGDLWAGGTNIIYNFRKAENNRYTESNWYYFDSDFLEECKISIINDTVFHFSESGINYFAAEEATFVPYPYFNEENSIISGFIFDGEASAWINKGNSWVSLEEANEKQDATAKILRLFDNIISINTDSRGNRWIIDDKAGIYEIDAGMTYLPDEQFRLFVSFVLNSENIIRDSEIIYLEKGDNLLARLSAPYYLKETTNEYQYFFEGKMKEWSEWTHNTEIPILFEPGEYILSFRARNILGNTSEAKTIKLYIKPPFTSSEWFYGLMGLSAIFIMWLLSNMRQRKLRYDKKVLEEKVKERTLEIENKKEKIEEQRDEILRQKEEITSSITYARRIQEAILPDMSQISRHFSDHFILYMPRDIVSGDFYWTAEGKGNIYFAVADCTGHGVPGAIMSMLGISLLNELTGEGTIDISTSDLLSQLRNKIINSLHNTGQETQAVDGMDISLFKLIKKTRTVQFSGAFNPLYHFRGNKLTEYKADRMPIGYFEKATPFTTQEFQIRKGDSLYLFSDGFIDQFGGPEDKRFSTRNFRISLTGIVDMPMDKQLEYLEARYMEWKGDREQVDDIIVAGLRF